MNADKADNWVNLLEKKWQNTNKIDGKTEKIVFPTKDRINVEVEK